MVPKGKLLIIGGAEDKGGNDAPDMASKNAEFEQFQILKELLPDDRRSGRIEVITTGTRQPEETKKSYEKVFRKIGYENTGFIHIDDKEGARKEEYLKRIRESHTVFFSGGDQFRLSTILGGTEISSIIMERYYEDGNFIVGGTSAGAMVMSRVMISEGGSSEALIDRDVKIASGFGLLETCIVDTHFIKRGRFGRLAHAVIINPGQLGIGLGEDTALIIRNGVEAECRGSGMVVVIDGLDIRQTNITDVEVGCPVFVENLKVHLLVAKCRFSLETRELAKPAIKPDKKKKEA